MGLGWQEGHLHIGGEWRLPGSPETISVASPATRQPIGQVPNAGEADVAGAVAAASAATKAWGDLDPLDRGRHLRNLAEIIRGRMSPLAELESAITGRPIREMRAQM